jgi:TnpA family transposase
MSITTLSSRELNQDIQYFRTGDVAQGKGQVNPKYGFDPARQLYTHVSNPYSPFSRKIINVGVRGATYVLDRTSG